jgi:acyl-homoserine lactone synthase
MLHISGLTGPFPGNAVQKAMFAARKSVFVDLLKWSVPVIGGLYECDELDSPDATYLILADAGGRHLASARLLPTDRPHLLNTHFAQLCDERAPSGPHIFEISRFCLDRALRAPVRRRVRDSLIHALVDHALETGITSYSAIAPTAWSRQILAFGWQCQPLGPPMTIGDARLEALRIDIDDTTSAALCAQGLLPDLLCDRPTRAAA